MNPIRYPIRYKIFFVSLVPTLALLVAAVINNQYLSSLGLSAEQILSKNYKSIRAAQAARISLEEIRNPLLGSPQLQNKLAIPQTILNELNSNLLICRENITETGERELIDRIFESHKRYLQLIASLPEAEDRRTAFFNLTGEMILQLDKLVAVNETAMEKADLETRSLANHAQRNAAFFFGIIISAILLLSYFFSYLIARPIMMLAEQLLNTPEKDGFYPEVQTRTNDEIGYLTQTFNRLFARLKEYDRHRDEILSAEREKVRRSEEAKGRFIADISHQIKTPMTSLSMSVGMLHSRGDSLSEDKRSTLINTACDDCMRLTALINELVDISRLESMSRPRPKETLDIGVVIGECIAPLLKQAEDRGITINVDIAEHLSHVTIDSFRFPWVITNLVGNALRYTGRGGRISLLVYVKDIRFYFECADTGSGIDPKFLPSIFDRFTQFSERGKGGTIGLGLAIVKDIIEQHGGDIRVESTPGKGTRFIFWIPGKVEKKA